MKEINYKEITRRMKEARVNANFTQDQFAKDLDCTPAYISNIEHNRTNLNLRTLIYYSRTCKVPVQYFLASEAVDNDSAEDQGENISIQEVQVNKELSALLQSFTVSEREKIVDMLKILKAMC